MRALYFCYGAVLPKRSKIDRCPKKHHILTSHIHHLLSANRDIAFWVTSSILENENKILYGIRTNSTLTGNRRFMGYLFLNSWYFSELKPLLKKHQVCSKYDVTNELIIMIFYPKTVMKYGTKIYIVLLLNIFTKIYKKALLILNILKKLHGIAS